MLLDSVPQPAIWFTIAPMLQDLDQLTTRIGQLVQRTRQMHAERDALRARLDEAERAARTLREQCAERDAALLALQAQLKDQDGEVATRLAESQRAEVALREQLEFQYTAHQSLESRLLARDADVEQLRQAAGSAQTRIDAVLARLPGAAPVAEGEHI